MRAPERLETARLVLRRPRRDDAEAILARYAGDAEVVRYLSWPRHAALEASRAFVAWSDEEWERWGVGPYLVESREDGRLLGSTGLAMETRTRAATGYVLARDAWGRGLATETLACMVALARTLGVVRLEAQCHPDNAASMRVLEKGGFAREGLLRRAGEYPNLAPGPIDTCLYSIILAETPRAPAP